MTRIQVLITGILIGALGILFCLLPKPLVVQASESVPATIMLVDSILCPLSILGKEDETSIYIAISDQDQSELPPKLSNHKLFKANSLDLTMERIEIWSFRATGGDMTTVNSSLYIVKNGKVVFECGILVEEDYVGIQHPDFGWLTAVNPESLIVEIQTAFKAKNSFFLII